jgi:hypothetical protein
MSIYLYVFVFGDLRRELVLRLIDIGGNAEHHITA